MVHLGHMLGLGKAPTSWLGLWCSTWGLSVRKRVTALVTMVPLFPRPDCDRSSQLVWYTLTNHHNHGYAGYGKPKPRNKWLISHLRCIMCITWNNQQVAQIFQLYSYSDSYNFCFWIQLLCTNVEIAHSLPVKLLQKATDCTSLIHSNKIIIFTNLARPAWNCGANISVIIFALGVQVFVVTIGGV